MTHQARGEELAVDSASVQLGGVSVLNSVDLVVPVHGFTGIIGPNGSGKSTLLRCIARLLAPESGAVFLGSDDVARLPRRQVAQRLALVEQNVATDLELTVLDVALLGRIPYQGPWQGSDQVDRTIARHHLDQVGMLDKEDRLWHTLSGGEQQRVQLARAFTQEPTVLAMDEPTNHLDIAHSLHLMSAVQHSGLTVIAALHDLNLAAMFCDALMVLHHGQVVAHGIPAQVLTPELVRDVYGVDAIVTPDAVTGQASVKYHAPAVAH